MSLGVANLENVYTQLIERIWTPYVGDESTKEFKEIYQGSQDAFTKVLALARQEYNSNYCRVFQPTVCWDYKNLALKMCFGKKTKVAQSLPISMSQLHNQIRLSFGGIFKDTIDLRDFDVYFKDGSDEKWFLESDDDLSAAYIWAKGFSTGMLKVWVEYKFGLTDEQKIERWHSSHSKQARNPGVARTKKWDFNAFEDENKVLVRDGYVYKNPKKAKGGKLLYFWEDYERLGCLGRWVVYPMVSGGDFGEIIREHNIPADMHQWNIPEINPMNLPNSENILHGGVRKWTRVYEGKKCNVQMTKKEVKKLIAALIMKNPSMIGSEIISEIKSWVSHADLPPKREIHYIIHKIRRALTPGVAGYGLIDIAKIKTLRGTPYGREISLSMVDQLPRLFLYLYSEWQDEIAKEAAKSEFLHIYVDLVHKCCPKMWKILVNVSIYQKDKSQFVPIAHSLLQTKRQEGFEISIKWIRDQLKLKPKIFTIEYDEELLKASKSVFGESLPTVPNFYLIMKRLLIQAGKFELKKPETFTDCKKLIYRLLALLFISRENIESVYTNIRAMYFNKDQGFSNFLQWYEATFMEKGLFPPRVWSFSHRSEQMHDMIMWNNGMEAYQHYIKTQIKSESPNFAAFTELMSRVETLHKNDYESFLPSEVYGESSQVTADGGSQVHDKVGSYKGVRLWPSSRLMKFLFDNRSTLESEPEFQFVEVDAMIDDFLKENSEEILVALNKVTRKDEDSVRDILAQENLHMNLEELINLKKEEKQKLKAEKEGKYEKYDPVKKLKREQKADFKREEGGYMSLGNDSSQNSIYSNFGVLGKKIKPEQDYEKESSIWSAGPSQFMHDLDITRNRVDIAERIMMYADDADDKNPFDMMTSQGNQSSQASVRSGYKELIDVIDSTKVKKSRD